MNVPQRGGRPPPPKPPNASEQKMSMEVDDGAEVPTLSALASSPQVTSPTGSNQPPSSDRERDRGSKRVVTVESSKRKKKKKVQQKVGSREEESPVDEKHDLEQMQEIDVTPREPEASVSPPQRQQQSVESGSSPQRSDESKNPPQSQQQPAERKKASEKRFRGVRKEWAIRSAADRSEGRFGERTAVVDGLADPRQFRSPVAIRRVMSRHFPEIAVHSASVLARGGISILCATEEDAGKLMQMQEKVEEVFGPRARVHPPTRMRLFRGLIRHLDTEVTEEEVKEELEEQGFNPKGLRRYIRKDGFVISTVEVDFATAEELSRAEKEGVRVGYMRCEVVRKIEGENVTQCFRCQGFGHIAARCSRMEKCMHCAERHDSRKCPGVRILKCSNCGGQHRSSDIRCPSNPLQARLEKVGRGVRSYAAVAGGRQEQKGESEGEAAQGGKRGPVVVREAVEEPRQAQRHRQRDDNQVSVESHSDGQSAARPVRHSHQDDNQVSVEPHPESQSVENRSQRHPEVVESSSEPRDEDEKDASALLSDLVMQALRTLSQEKKYSSIRMIASVLPSSALQGKSREEYEGMKKVAQQAARYGAADRRKRSDVASGESQPKRQAREQDKSDKSQGSDESQASEQDMRDRSEERESLGSSVPSSSQVSISMFPVLSQQSEHGNEDT